MIITMVQGKVPESEWQSLRDAYKSTTMQLEPQIVHTYLLQDIDDLTSWSIATIWISRQALEEYRQSVDTPGAFVLFRGIGIEPTRTILDVAVHAPH